MKSAAAVLLLLASGANGKFLLNKQNTTATVKDCGPQTQVCIAGSTSAAGDPLWECKPASSGAQVTIPPSASDMGAKICGPGKFYFSPMSCAGGRFEYKKQATEIVSSSWSGGMNCPDAGETVTFPYKMSCYAVEC
eukprot:TRINITY_DN1440_c0_g2_i1.p2 TRINITY_DN1440_c0_g2~~TRINITY_DN1440_c0_g2_i1.p2  ORF type:complete len:136 (+),score=38.89 TRINITY_DN1440_c0_g2_i1:401-808(+)